MAGYDEHFDPPLESKDKCPICLLALREPVQTSCGRRVCRGCTLPSTRDAGPKCPVDNEHLDVSQGHSNSCEFIKIICVHPECGMLMKKADLLKHLETECKCRLESCGFCKMQINLHKMKLHHEGDCPAYPVECEKCSKDGTPRAKLLEHQDPVLGDCDGVQGPCPFSQIGCPHTEVLSQGQKKRHLKQKNAYHTTLVLNYAIRMSREMEALLMRDPRIMSRSPNIFTNYDDVIANLLSQVQTGTAENRDLREKCREHSKRITSLERKYRNVKQHDTVLRRMESIQQELALAHGNVPQVGLVLNDCVSQQLDTESYSLCSPRYLMSEIRELKKHRRRLEDEVQVLKQKIEAQKTSCEGFHAECVVERSRGVDCGRMESELLQNLMDRVQKSLGDLQNTVADLLTSHTDLRNSHTDLTNTVADLRNRHTDLRNSHTDLTNTVADLEMRRLQGKRPHDSDGDRQ